MDGMDGVNSPDSRDGDTPGDEIGDRNVDGDGVDHVSTDIAVSAIVMVSLAVEITCVGAAVTAGLISIGLDAITAKFGAESALISSITMGGMTATIGGVLANALVIAASICAAVGAEAKVILGTVATVSSCIVTTGDAVVTAMTPGMSGISG